MDIYQIWITYNKPWSKCELCFWGVVLALTIIIVVLEVRRKTISVIQAISICILIIFLGLVFSSTIFTRISTVRQYELQPFWSWRKIIKYHDWELLKENLLNCILLLPVGALLPLIVKHKVKWYRALLIGILMSAMIEISQLVLKRGLFEWDDIIHNGLGCMMGCLIVNWGQEIWRKISK